MLMVFVSQLLSRPITSKCPPLVTTFSALWPYLSTLFQYRAPDHSNSSLLITACPENRMKPRHRGFVTSGLGGGGRGREWERFHNRAVRVWAHGGWCRRATLWDPSVLLDDHSTRGLAYCGRGALFGVNLRRWILSRHDSWAVGDHSEPVKSA